MIKKKNLFKNITLFLCLVPMLVLSFFCLIPQNCIDSARAADVEIPNYTFVGSEFFMPALGYNNNSIDRYNFGIYKISLTFNNGVYGFVIDGTINHQTLNTQSPSVIRLNTLTATNVGSGSTDYRITQSTTSYHNRITVTRYGSLTNNINRVVFSSNSNNTCMNYITYYDVTGNFIRFGFWLGISDGGLSTYFLLDERTYYINLDNLQDSTYYQNGYDAGYEVGLNDGSSSGYTSGYDNGYNVGYAGGYSVGIAEGSDYSFSSLFGAVIDAPVTAFTSLLSFDILGVNILALVTGLLSVAIIVLIVKLCMGGK